MLSHLYIAVRYMLCASYNICMFISVNNVYVSEKIRKQQQQNNLSKHC